MTSVTSRSRKISSAAYTLIEALVASAILMVGIGSAASLSLSLITQEEINERSARAGNYLENTAALYYLGFDTADIGGVLPEDRVVKNMVFAAKTPGGVDMMQARIVYAPNDAVSNNIDTLDEYTGGDRSARRRHTIRMIRGPSSYSVAP